MKIFSVYILKCRDDSFYVGITNDVQRRLSEHQQEEDSRHYTFSRRPVQLVYIGEFTDVHIAIAHEKQLKGWSRAKKTALIEGNWHELQRLAECRNISHHINKDH